MPAEKHYYNLDRAGLVCLSCTLRECVHMPGADPDDVCPIDGAIPQPARASGSYTQKRRERLRLIDSLLQDVGTASIAIIAEKSGIPIKTLLCWAWKGYIETETVKLPKGAQPGRRDIRVIVGVNL